MTRIAILMTVCLACIMPDQAAKAQNDSWQEISRLTVNGEAELRVPADQLRLTVGVLTEASSSAQALEKNSARMRKVIDAVVKAGLTAGEYQTGRLRLEPQWSMPPRQLDAQWRPQVIGYSALNTLRIRTGKIGLAGELISAAAGAGANEIGELVFDLADPRRHRAEAIQAATVNAFADARALGDAAKVSLKRVLSLDLDQAPVTPFPMAAARMEMMADAPPPVTPGEVTVRAGVTVTFEIEPTPTEPLLPESLPPAVEPEGKE